MAKKCLEPTSTSDQENTATVILQPPPLPAANKKSETTTNQTALLQESTTINVLVDVDQVSYDCDLSVNEPEEELELQDDELRRKVEEFIEKINRGWKAEKLSLALTH